MTASGGASASGGISGSGGGAAGNGGAAGGGAPGSGGAAGGAKGTLRLMPLGDSTTASVCYRAVLWDLLNKAGHAGKFDFVGSNKSNSDPKGASCTPSNADPDNEGHPSCLITEVVDNVNAMSSRSCNTTLNMLKPALMSHPADLVLMHFATNDVWNSIATSKILAAYGTIIDSLRAVNPNVIVLLAKIIPMNVTASTCSGCSCSACGSNIDALNGMVTSWAAAKSTGDSPVVVVDQFTGFDATADTVDGVHPNASGSTKIATKWAAALASYF
jgi:lysophospholipase L1-like esterase